ncbi:MAG: LLM class flavin-dependent oxidoreductase [Chloroflexota bacterium]|nr:LLM class flavin-dependent oxidoreductase [Chloroflexota bacterium]
MQYGFVIPGGDVLELMDLAAEIEAAGWDGVFIADAVYSTDPWVALAAMATRTERVKIGPLLTPPSRRRPWKLASEVATLDRLSSGRAVLPVGLGAPDTGFDKVGEAVDRKTRAALLDETLELLLHFWSGEKFRFDGEHYTVHWDSDWLYTPVQQPRVPIWVVGAWPRRASMARALKYDGVIPVKLDIAGTFSPFTSDDIREVVQYAKEHRTETSPFDIIMEGVTPVERPDNWNQIIEPLAEAGATWWIESMWDVPGGMDAVRQRIRQGPPRVA